MGLQCGATEIVKQRLRDLYDEESSFHGITEAGISVEISTDELDESWTLTITEPETNNTCIAASGTGFTEDTDVRNFLVYDQTKMLSLFNNEADDNWEITIRSMTGQTTGELFLEGSETREPKPYIPGTDI